MNTEERANLSVYMCNIGRVCKSGPLASANPICVEDSILFDK